MKLDYYKRRDRKLIYKMLWDLYPRVLKHIKIKKGEKILDAACGEGLLANYLKISNLYGFDLNLKSVKKARKKRYKKVIRSSTYKLSYKNKEFDKTICIGVFQYLKEPKKAFDELTRVTKKELILTVPNYNWFRLKALIKKDFRKFLKEKIKEENFTNKDFLKKLAKQKKLKLKIKYASSSYDFIRNLFGNCLASEIIGIYRLK